MIYLWTHTHTHALWMRVQRSQTTLYFNSMKIRRGTWILTQPETNHTQRHLHVVSTVLKGPSTSVAKCIRVHGQWTYTCTHVHTHLISGDSFAFSEEVALLASHHQLHESTCFNNHLSPLFLSLRKRWPFPASRTQFSPPPSLPPNCLLTLLSDWLFPIIV